LGLNVIACVAGAEMGVECADEVADGCNQSNYAQLTNRLAIILFLFLFYH
jgi:hypothetical protein